jgi:menaquinol-cytochrome c reductase iron-sulfur subunit
VDSSREHPYRAGRSYWPWGIAFGVLVLLYGIATSWEVAAAGLVITVFCVFLWVRRLARTRALLEAEEPEADAPAAAAAEPGYQPPEQPRYGRAAFLGVTTLGLSQVIGGVVTLPVLGFMVLPPFLKQHWKPVDLGKLAEFPENKWIVVTFLADPAQGEVSRKTAFVRNNGFLGKEPSYTIISNHCAHLGCPVQPSAPLSTTPTQYKDVTLIALETTPSGFGCPCHGGQYDIEGNRTAGPPVRSLDRYAFSIINGHLYLDTPYSVGKVVGTGADAKIYKYKRHYPGVPVQGIESWLYPITPPTG